MDGCLLGEAGYRQLYGSADLRRNLAVLAVTLGETLSFSIRRSAETCTDGKRQSTVPSMAFFGHV